MVMISALTTLSFNPLFLCILEEKNEEVNQKLIFQNKTPPLAYLLVSVENSTQFSFFRYWTILHPFSTRPNLFKANTLTFSLSKPTRQSILGSGMKECFR